MKRREKFSTGMKSAYSSKKRIIASITMSVIIFAAMNLAARPVFSEQMVSSSIFHLPEAVLLVFLYNSSDIVQMSSTVVYALLAGPAMTIMYIQFKSNGSGLANLSKIAPGFIASGCAGCGVGLVGLVGLTGALAAMPFNGLLITPAGILLLIYFITQSGDPEICEIK